ncbi:MAG: chromosome segregation SMC family protein [Hyphomicrobiaceae bacterium]
MQITRLRLMGFKSFVEPTELWIEPGLTGVVGPNGCGKSNLLEALRWAMGETSYKAMRAAAMEDVIFGGTTTRPARNWAEVTMFVDNSARKAPPGFNDNDELELTRRIERDMGSAYRINGRDVRARDVKVLFEDAATGARSPALVRQGQIGEIVNAKPEQRRRILEDAAGVAGLHTRRHEAELRLRSAEDNLARIGDVLGGLTAQIDGLKRQARQARRYRELSGEIRCTEALAAHLAWTAAQATVETGESALRDALIALAETTAVEAQALAEEAETAEALPPLREAEAEKGAIIARLRIERETFEKEAERLQRRRDELEARLGQLQRDLARESGLAAEAAETMRVLDGEAAELAARNDDDGPRESEAETALTSAEVDLRTAESALSEMTRRAFEAKARRQSLERVRAERVSVVERARRDLAGLESQLAEAAARAPDAARHRAAAEVVDRLSGEAETIEAQSIAAEEQLEALSETAAALREASSAAQLDASRMAIEIATIEKLLMPPAGQGYPPVIDRMTVTAGLEAALAAALGDDLDAAVEDASAQHWRLIAGSDGDPPLPAGARPLLDDIDGPAELTRRLSQIGVVARADGRRLQEHLKPGQRLVSREGDLWRWDGFVAAADAPSAAALRLAERNRLGHLKSREAALARDAGKRAQDAERAAQRRAAAEGEARRLRHLSRDTQTELARARDALGAIERHARETEQRRQSLEEARGRLTDGMVEAEEQLLEAEAALDILEADDGLDESVAIAENAAHRARATHAERREAVQALVRERRQRADRLAAIARERERWVARVADTGRQAAALQARHGEIAGELEGLDDLPAMLDERRQRLIDEIAAAERNRQAAADRHAAAEGALKRAQQALRTAQGLVAEGRETRARAEAQLDAARARRAVEGRRIREALDVAPEDCLALAGETPASKLPSQADAERRLTRLKSERDRLGGVNLKAEDELTRLSEEHARLDAERADVEQAVLKLRGAIGQLNREARKRLGDAFKTVDGHFRRLFSTLFGGGEARLEMIESEEDPLQGGLEIIAKPPGKKPATLSLLSGGEQSLTALSLIFAVFLTNPSPICVLDEVDAPLDDSNVDRFCTLMEQMAAETSTRFLVITHHPMTMARMNRLFGVTMAEKGVSQLVSVDLATAERIIEDDGTDDERAAI